MKLPAGHLVQCGSPSCVEWLPGGQGVLSSPSHEKPMGQMRQQSSTVHAPALPGLLK